MLLLLYGLVVAGTMISAWALDGTWGFIESAGKVSTATLAVATVPGALLLYLNVMGLIGIVDLDARLARRHLAPSVEETLTRRISELAVSRAEVVEVVNDERRRIERDLHDGVQQRLVALGLLLSRARRTRDPVQAPELVRQAHEESEQALADLRDVAWRVYPHSPRPTRPPRRRSAFSPNAPASRSDCTTTWPTDRQQAIETVAYFVISEALTNAAKHSPRQPIDITLTRSRLCTADETDATSPSSVRWPPVTAPTAGHNSHVLIAVADNGRGGADPHGRGLTGLAGRVCWRCAHDQPVHRGGPTTIQAEFPCE